MRLSCITDTDLPCSRSLPPPRMRQLNASNTSPCSHLCHLQTLQQPEWSTKLQLSSSFSFAPNLVRNSWFIQNKILKNFVKHAPAPRYCFDFLSQNSPCFIQALRSYLHVKFPKCAKQLLATRGLANFLCSTLSRSTWFSSLVSSGYDSKAVLFVTSPMTTHHMYLLSHCLMFIQLSFSYNAHHCLTHLHTHLYIIYRAPTLRAKFHDCMTLSCSPTLNGTGIFHYGIIGKNLSIPVKQWVRSPI